jgi:hypothetical protein
LLYRKAKQVTLRLQGPLKNRVNCRLIRWIPLEMSCRGGGEEGDEFPTPLLPSASLR